MYERYFAFKDHPFRLTPDPDFLFLGAKHREGFAHLLFAMREGSGFVAVTGEVGTGKTTLVRALLRETEGDVSVAYIFNPVLSATELLQTINAEFGLPARSTSKKELTDALNNFLVAQKQEGGRAVVIVDEAQNLEPAVLEQLRLLSNLETETEKLLQIILLGQPELRDVLDRTELRQLSQRISLRWHLDPLNKEEVVRYVRHRLKVAGGEEDLFDERALDLVYEHTSGIPRLVNILAHRSLLVAYTRGEGGVSAAEVQTAAAELGQGRVPLQTVSKTPWYYKAAAGAGVALAAAGVAFLLVAPLRDTETRDAVAEPAPVVPAERASAPPPPPPEPVVSEKLRAEVDRFVRRVGRLDAFDATVGSVSRLVELWTGSGLTEAEVGAGSIDVESLAERRGLRYLGALANEDLLRLIDLPAVVELRGADDETRVALLKELDDDHVDLVLERPVRVSRDAFNQVWTGTAHILWRDPEALRQPMTPGQRGPAVSRLQALLREIGVLATQANGVYDQPTVAAVETFQDGQGLNADGVAGTVTQIVLYNALGKFARPTLAGTETGGGAEAS